MDEEISQISTNTRNEKIKNFFVNNKNKIIIIFSFSIILLIGYFVYQEIDKRNKVKISDQYNNSKINYYLGNKENIENTMIEIIKAKDKSYSPLALYFLLDNNIINSKDKINNLFDLVINEISHDKEIKNLNIYKKALYNSEHASETDLIKILNPIINSDSVWESHALYLLGEYFLSKNEKQKAKEFFEKILILENINLEIKLEAENRLKRDLSE